MRPRRRRSGRQSRRSDTRHASKSIETKRKYRRHLATVATYLETLGVRCIRELKLTTFDGYIGANEEKTWTWLKRVELLKQFLRFCISRNWCTGLDLKELKAPRLEEANQVVPYTPAEVARIITACDFIGRNDYERRRARAMVLLMRFAGLRVSDVVTLSRDHIEGGLLKKQAVKNRKWIRVTVRPELAEALERLPRPKAASLDSKLYFASDTSTCTQPREGCAANDGRCFQACQGSRGSLSPVPTHACI